MKTNGFFPPQLSRSTSGTTTIVPRLLVTSHPEDMMLVIS